MYHCRPGGPAFQSHAGPQQPYYLQGLELASLICAYLILLAWVPFVFRFCRLVVFRALSLYYFGCWLFPAPFLLG